MKTFSGPSIKKYIKNNFLQKKMAILQKRPKVVLFLLHRRSEYLFLYKTGRARQLNSERRRSYQRKKKKTYKKRLYGLLQKKTFCFYRRRTSSLLMVFYRRGLESGLLSKKTIGSSMKKDHRGFYGRKPSGLLWKKTFWPSMEEDLLFFY